MPKYNNFEHMSDQGNMDADTSIISDLPYRSRAKSSYSYSDYGGAIKSILRNNNKLNIDYGSFAKGGEWDIDRMTFKTGFSFLDEAKDDAFSQLSSATNIGSSQPIHAFLNLFKVFIGIGILTGPAAMSHWGIILGALGVTFAGLLSFYSINIQAQTRHKLQESLTVSDLAPVSQDVDLNEAEADQISQVNNDDSMISHNEELPLMINNYTQLGYAAYGQSGFLFVSLCLFIQQMGTVTAYFWFINRYIPIPFALMIILPFCLFLNIKRISYISLFSLFAICCALALVIFHSVDNMGSVSKHDVKFFDIMNFPLSFGVSIFIFEGNWASLQIETSMKEPKKFKYVSLICIILVIVLNWLISTIAYVSYVNEIEDIVLFNLPGSFISKLIRLGYSMGLIFSIPIQIAPMVDTVYRSEIFDSYVKLFRDNPRSKYYIGVIVILLTWVTFALLISQIQMFLNLSGSFVGILTLAILPIMFYNKAFFKEISKTRLIIHYAIIIGMSIMGAISIYFSLDHMISE